MKISIIIFCYNESDSLATLIDNSIATLKLIASSFEIIIVDDGSTDNTASIAKEYKAKYPLLIKIISHKQNLGIGMALHSGYNAAVFEYVCAIPGDGQFGINQLTIIKPFDDNVYYSFYRVKTGYNVYRRILTVVNRLYNQYVMGIYLRDVNWIKVYRKSQLDIVKPELKSSLIESEICAKLNKYRAVPIEIPSEYLAREYGISKGGSWKTLRMAIAEVIILYKVTRKFNPPRKAK
jgi:glycosyltransferase involved in cell wall biosynthesis